jgi:hypothetical protein
MLTIKFKDGSAYYVILSLLKHSIVAIFKAENYTYLASQNKKKFEFKY